MQNKSRSRSDVRWVLWSLSLAATLGLWSVFASHDKKVAGVAAQVTILPPADQVVISQSQALMRGQKLLFGGTAPQQSQHVIVTRTHGAGGGGGGPAASTGSSKP